MWKIINTEQDNPKKDGTYPIWFTPPSNGLINDVVVRGDGKNKDCWMGYGDFRNGVWFLNNCDICLEKVKNQIFAWFDVPNYE